MKKLLILLLCVFLLVAPLCVTATAVEEQDKLCLSDAYVTEIEGKKFLSVELENATDSRLCGINLFLKHYDKTALAFSESINNSLGYPAAQIDELGPMSKVTVLFELEQCHNDKAEVDLAAYFYCVGDSVHAGDPYHNADYGEAFFYSVLNREKSGGMLSVLKSFLEQTGFSMLLSNLRHSWKNLVMLAISFFLIFLAIKKKFEPLLLLPIAFGMLLTNLPGAEMYHPELFADGTVHWDMFAGVGAGLLDYLYLGIKLGIYPCLIFLGIGAMTDFGPLIANPKSLLLGAAAQLGIFITYFAANSDLFGFAAREAASIGIIGGADGPTAIFVTSMLAPELLGPIAVAAYSYMALVPFIQPPIMKLLTTKKERAIVMTELRPVSKTEKLFFPIVVTVFVALLVPSATPLIGCLMLGNLMRESGVVDRIAKAAQNELMNIVTIFLGISVGATATAENFLNWRTFGILLMGIVAFSFGTAGGVLLAKFMNLFLKKKINPLIGSAGVSAVPMAARVSQTVGQKENPSNFLLMHAMGPNVAGVIGSAIAAGVLIALFG